MMYSVIIIDDEKEIREGFARFFPWESLGFSVSGVFASVARALDYLSCRNVDVIISDIIMPDMTGIELAKILSQRDTRPLLVLFSAHERFSYAQQALQYGCTDYWLKSSDYDELVASANALRQKLDTVSLSSTGHGDEDDRIIASIKEYVREAPSVANLESIAARVYLSSSYVSRYFKQKTGINFTDYVVEQRMKLAATYLVTLKYKIYEISDLVGYSTPFNFTRSFKKYFGCSPREYRLAATGSSLSPDGVHSQGEKA